MITGNKIEDITPDLILDKGDGVIYIGWLLSKTRAANDLTDCVIKQVTEDASGNFSIKYPHGILSPMFDWNEKEKYSYDFLKH